MSTKSFSTNFSFNSKTSNALIKAIEASTSLEKETSGNLKMMNKHELKDKLNKRVNAH
ncbi:hypothetical protein [Convivina intestini]|uniref:hypothetical protein n=1 Tax=Convivina intestini TaxID=1505726 RepID=UPI00200EA710|nr:hypothetical protein [Convivina intestini]CAH1853147.1 hypothetical protein R078131_00653 [Convivina intestini]